MTETVYPDDEKWMTRAIRLARKGWGRTAPNPMVGAVAVKNDRVAGEGYHRAAGEPHAEIHALRQAGNAAVHATVYVTIEPCSTQGRTPACTAALVKAGVQRVVIGCLDPNPAHAGNGVRQLRENGIEVVTGVRERQCREINEAFFKWITCGTPFILLKMAATLDGRIATRAGDSKWITGKPERRYVQRLRQWSDAIMVGGETVRLDNPALSVRAPRNWPNQPKKLIWTRQPSENYAPDLKIWHDPAHPPRFICPESYVQWYRMMKKLGEEQVTALLIEGGGELAARCLNTGIVDKIAFFIAPKLLGGRDSRPVIGGPSPSRLSEAIDLNDMRTRRIGKSILVTGYPEAARSPGNSPPLIPPGETRAQP